jgi:hypothetical protein
MRLSSLPTEMASGIRRLEFWVDTKEMLAWTEAWEDGGLNEWKGILRTIKRVVNVDNLWLIIDIGSREDSSWVGQDGGWEEDFIRSQQMRMLKCVKDELGRPKKFWVRGMLWDDSDQEAEKAIMGAEYDSFAEGKANVRDREWWA